MTYFVLNLLLALLWMFMWGSFDAWSLLVGLVLGYALMGTAAGVTGHRYGRQVWDLLSFFFYFMRILVQANWQVAKIVLSPSMPIAPRIMRYDVSDLTPAQVTTLANAITLTPGTLVMDIDPDGRFLYIHGISAADRAAALRSLDELRDRLLKEVFGK